jgi:hypothetical protein
MIPLCLSVHLTRGFIMRPHTRGLRCLLVGIAVLSACNDAPNRPSETRLEGTYTATTFTITTPDTSFDELAAGTSLTVTLNSDGTTSGSLIVPDLITDLAGQWDTAGATLRLHLPVPTFLTRIDFATAPNALVGELSLQTDTFHLTLTK